MDVGGKQREQQMLRASCLSWLLSTFVVFCFVLFCRLLASARLKS